jgi:hypothetical protein
MPSPASDGFSFLVREIIIVYAAIRASRRLARASTASLGISQRPSRLLATIRPAQISP